VVRWTTDDEGDSKMAIPPLPSKVGNIAEFKKGDKAWKCKIIDEIVRVVSNDPNTTACLQKLQFESDGHIEVRFCYYYYTDDGKWTFMRQAPYMPVQDFQAMIREAVKKGWISVGNPSVGN
jgi:hypothetical protein